MAQNLQTTGSDRGADISPSEAFRDNFKRMESEVKAALPPHIPVDRFMRVVLTAVNGNPDLLNADRRSLFAAAMKAAQDGLLPDGRDGAFVVFNAKEKGENGRDTWIKKVQWMPMIGGVLKKVRNSGDLLTISAYVVYANDKFFYRLGDEERIEHEPALDEPGAPRLVYAIAKTKDGGVYREVMTLSQVEKVRNVSKAKDSGPWIEWWDEMARKTVLRRLSKRLPTSADLDDLLRRDDDLYDFSGKRDEPAPFTPIKNPLKDRVEQIDHRADDEEQNGGGGVEGSTRDDSGHSDGTENVAAKGAENREGEIPAKARQSDQERSSSSQATSGAKTEKNEPRAAASKPAASYEQTSESYMEFMRDAFDAARSASAIRDVWSRTRDDRKELLSDSDIAALTEEKSAALEKHQPKG